MVTCHDELLDSPEGLERLICERVYLTNCGNLRHALVCLRRAATILQLMGLHRYKPQGMAPKLLDPSTRVSIEFTWGHIAYLERYISLLLGLPTSITSARFATDKKSAHQTDAEWFEKTQIDICELIISRNQDRTYDFTTTQNIEGLLNKVAGSMPVQWWKPMEFYPGIGPVDMMSRMISAQMQIIHYNLLTVLHLPFILQPNTLDYVFDYNRETCMYASREVLTRFIYFRSIVQVVYCCRPVDFCAFTAAMTLLLAHLSRSGQTSDEQRVGDRALIEKTLETLDELHRLNDDDLSRETARITRRLLELEKTIGNDGVAYSCQLVKAHHSSQEGADLDPSQGFCLQVPYFGYVSLAAEPRVVRRTAGPEASSFYQYATPHPGQSWLTQQLPLTISQPRFHDSQSHIDLDMPMPEIADSDEWAIQGVDTAFFDMLIGGAGVGGGRGSELGNRDTDWSNRQ
ncbi:hypothetical protein EJ02DRAFT_399501 [Clathrospora elynae]|uniref:Transcription factor domain-containing protein n=1 Tax=Clathrospora elynae TaxID=706981 RepID=A0A6A5SZZ9_9PLEO|nr:hypothetical protein EJ02DRAFT_399501 [Clathrospora elynae]